MPCTPSEYHGFTVYDIGEGDGSRHMVDQHRPGVREIMWGVKKRRGGGEREGRGGRE